MTKDFNVSVSMNQAAPVKTGVVLKQGDFGFDLKITVMDFTVTGSTPQIVFRKPMGAVESTDVTASGNVYTYTFKGTELDTPGKVFCDLKLKNSTTQRISSASFQFECIADTLDGLAEESSSYSDTIADIAESLQNYSTDSEAWAAGTKNGTPVSSTDAQYRNNAKYYAELTANTVDYSKNTINSALETNNLAYKYSFELGYLSTAGTINPTNDYATSDYIDTQGASSIAMNKALRFVVYNSEKTKLAVVSPDPSTNVVAALGGNVKYLRFTIPVEDVQNAVVMLTNDAADLSNVTWDLKNSPALDEIKATADTAYETSNFNGEKIDAALVTNNLVYYQTFMDGYLSTDGTVSPSPGYVTSDFISIEGESYIAINKSLRYALYNSEKAKITVTSPDPSTNIVIGPMGNNVKYLRFTIAESDVENSVVMATSDVSDLSNASWDLRDSKNFESVKNTAETALKNSNININSINSALITDNLVHYQTFADGYLSTDGTVSPSPGYVTSDFIDTQGASNIGMSKTLRYVLYDSGKSKLSVVSPDPNTNVIAALGSNVKYLRFTIAQSDAASSVVKITNSATDLSFESWDLKSSQEQNEIKSNAETAYNLSTQNQEAISGSLENTNILVGTDFVDGYLTAQGDGVNPSPGYITSDFIPVHKGNISMVDTYRVGLYNSSKEPIGVQNPSPVTDVFTLNLGGNVAYLRLTIADTKTAILSWGEDVKAIWKPTYDHTSIRVGNSANCDFDNIQAAIEAITDDSETKPYIIYIEPGTYSKINMRTGKSSSTERVRYISLIGLSSCEDTIIYDNKGNYDNSPAEIFATGVIKNLSFINNTSAATKEPSELHDYAFALHVGAFAEGTGAVKLLIEDCYCFSNAGAAFGCGTMQDNTIVVRNSKFVSDNDTECNGATWQGGFYLHTNGLSETTNQNLKIYNSWIQSKCYTNGAAIQERTGYTSHLNFEICNTAIIGTNGPALELHQNITPVFGSFNNLPDTLNNLTPSN